MFDLSKKIAVITGGGSGIGLEISKLFAKQGAQVFILDFDEEKGRSVSIEINNAGGNSQFVHCDISLQDSVKRAFHSIDKDHIDILVNNAGIAHIGNIENCNERDLDRLYEVNIKGVYNCLRESIKKMKIHGGVILNVASVAALVGIKDRFGYSMTKGAVLTMTYSIAKDYLDEKIRCNAIAPGRIHTPFVDGFLAKNYPGKEKEMFDKLSKTQPIGRMGKPEEVAAMALYLCSDEAAFITGTCYNIDGGFVTLNS